MLTVQYSFVNGFLVNVTTTLGSSEGFFNSWLDIRHRENVRRCSRETDSSRDVSSPGHSDTGPSLEGANGRTLEELRQGIGFIF